MLWEDEDSGVAKVIKNHISKLSTTRAMAQGSKKLAAKQKKVRRPNSGQLRKGGEPEDRG